MMARCSPGPPRPWKPPKPSWRLPPLNPTPLIWHPDWSWLLGSRWRARCVVLAFTNARKTTETAKIWPRTTTNGTISSEIPPTRTRRRAANDSNRHRSANNLLHIRSSVLRKTLAPYRIGKRPHKQNRGKIPSKNTENRIFLVFLMYFWAILRVAVFSYPVGGQVFPNKCAQVRPAAWWIWIGAWLRLPRCLVLGSRCLHCRLGIYSEPLISCWMLLQQMEVLSSVWSSSEGHNPPRGSPRIFSEPFAIGPVQFSWPRGPPGGDYNVKTKLYVPLM